MYYLYYILFNTCLQVTNLSISKKATNLQSEMFYFWFFGSFFIILNKKHQIKLKSQYYFKDNEWTAAANQLIS